MNLQAYRKGLEFGFTGIDFDQYGWFNRPAFLDTEDLQFGDTSRYGNHSIIYLGHGINGIWTYGLNYSFGAGGCYGLSVYGKQFKSSESELTFALNDLKAKMNERVGSTNTTNHKQPIILATLKDIKTAIIGLYQFNPFLRVFLLAEKDLLGKSRDCCFQSQAFALPWLSRHVVFKSADSIIKLSISPGMRLM